MDELPGIDAENAPGPQLEKAVKVEVEVKKEEEKVQAVNL